jgi:hypothetical protein
MKGRSKKEEIRVWVRGKEGLRKRRRLREGKVKEWSGMKGIKERGRVIGRKGRLE